MPTYSTDSSYTQPHWPFTHMSGGQKLLLGISSLAVALAAAPFVLPALGIGQFEQFTALATCSTGSPTGLAGQSANLLSHIPFVGDTLAQGGIWNGVGAGVVAIAGNMAANQMKNQSQNKSIFSWHGLVRSATLATSALIAAPALLQSITMGVDYLSLVAGLNLYGDMNSFNGINSFAQEYIGKLGTQGASAGASALSASSALVPHILSCGVGAGVGGAALSHGAHHAAAGEQPLTVIKPISAQVEKIKGAMALTKQSMAEHVLTSRDGVSGTARLA